MLICLFEIFSRPVLPQVLDTREVHDTQPRIPCLRSKYAASHLFIITLPSAVPSQLDTLQIRDSIVQKVALSTSKVE